MKELLIYALEVLVCSAALLLAYSVLLERRTAFLHCRLYLIGAMLLAALIPALSIPVWTGETLYMAADPVAAAAPTAAPAATDAGTPSLPVAVTLFLYALGVLLSFGAMIAQIVRIRRLRHGARTIRRADCDIVLTQADISSFSFFRTVYLHDAIPESDMAAVVAHELSHIRHRHSAERIVMECVKALLWWNPFVRIAARRLAEVEEYEADRDVLTQGYDPSEYIATIFKTQFGYSPDIANGLRDSLTKKRFQMMTKHSGDSRALLRLAGSIPVVLLLLACFSFTSQATEIRTDPPNGQSDSDIEIVSVGTIRKAPDTQERYRKANGEADVYLVAEKMPLFEGKGTLQDFQHWVDARAAEYDRSGKVILTFVVEKNGSVAEVQVLDTPDPAMGEAAARIVASSPAWKAGTIDGEPVRVRYTLPVRCGKTDPQTTGRQASVGHSRSIDQKALVFIDDKEVKQDTLKTMNPDLIESISVYKDSSAVVRYGERGKNGVILIKMKLPVYPIGSFYFIRGKLSSIRSGTTSTSGQSSKELQFANLLLRNAPLKPDPDMEKRLNDPLIQYYIKFILPKFCKSDKKSYFW